MSLAAGVEPYEQTTAPSPEAFHVKHDADPPTPGLPERIVTLTAGVEPYERTTAPSSEAFHVKHHADTPNPRTGRPGSDLGLLPYSPPEVACDRDTDSTPVSIATWLAQAGE